MAIPRIGRFGQAHMRQLIALVMEDPAVKEEIVDLLQKDPRAVLQQAFDFTPLQQQRFDALPDAVVQQHAQIAVTTLKADATLTFRMSRPRVRPGQMASPSVGPGGAVMRAFAVPIPGPTVGPGMSLGGSVDMDRHGRISGGMITVSGGDC